VAIADPSQNYIDANWGDPELEWTAELEAELPEELQDWSLFEVVDGELRPKAKTYTESR